jgi:hypothetical protein
MLITNLAPARLRKGRLGAIATQTIIKASDTYILSPETGRHGVGRPLRYAPTGSNGSELRNDGGTAVCEA